MHRADLGVRRADGRAPQVPRVDRAVRRRDADERAVRRAGRRAGPADLRRRSRRKTRISLRVEQKVVVQYACDGKQFAVSVRDAFGTLERATVLQYLYKCLHAEQQIDRKAGGAGLGLYLMVNSATHASTSTCCPASRPRRCACSISSRRSSSSSSFGFFTEKIDAAGRLAAGPSRRLPAGTSHPVERRAHGPDRRAAAGAGRRARRSRSSRCSR